MQRFKIEYVIWISIVSFSIVVSFQHNLKELMLPHQLLTAPLFQHCMTKSTHFHLLTPSPFISSGKFANPLFLISPPTIRGRRVHSYAFSLFLVLSVLLPTWDDRCASPISIGFLPFLLSLFLHSFSVTTHCSFGYIFCVPIGIVGTLSFSLLFPLSFSGPARQVNVQKKQLFNVSLTASWELTFRTQEHIYIYLKLNWLQEQ